MASQRRRSRTRRRRVVNTSHEQHPRATRCWCAQRGTSASIDRPAQPRQQWRQRKKKKRDPGGGGSRRSLRQADHLVRRKDRRAFLANPGDLSVEHDRRCLQQSSEPTACGGDRAARAGDVNGGNPSDLDGARPRGHRRLPGAFRRAASLQRRA